MTSNALTAILWFVAILVLIPASLWLLKRTPIGGRGSGGRLRSVAVLPLSAQQRIVTVEVGQGASRRWLVLGVTAQQISTLHTMAPEDTPGDAPETGAPTFGQLLAKWRPRPAGASDE